MPDGPVFLAHPSSLDHDTGGHPEQAARITAIERELDERGWLGFERVESQAVDRRVLAAVHPEPSSTRSKPWQPRAVPKLIPTLW